MKFILQLPISNLKKLKKFNSQELTEPSLVVESPALAAAAAAVQVAQLASAAAAVADDC